MLTRTLAATVLLAVAPPQERWETRTYLPPAEPGYIYTVIEPAPTAPVNVAVQWGVWRQTGRFEGRVVLRLRHERWDQHPVTVGTSGRIVAGPLQGDPPPQWEDATFARVIW